MNVRAVLCLRAVSSPRSLFCVAVFCAVLIALAWPANASAFCRLTTVKNATPDASGCIREGIPLSWDRRCFSYTLHQDGSNEIPLDEVRSLVAASFAPWTQVTCSDGGAGFMFSETQQMASYDTPYFNTDGGNHNAIIFVSDWSVRDHDPRAFALTTVWHDKSNGRIVDADMEINESRGMLGACAENNNCQVDSGCRDIDLANVITHEAGHFLGLAHSDVADSTMYDSAPIGETCKRSLEEDDVDGLCSAYPAGSLPDVCNATPNGGYNFGAPSTRDDCGCATRPPSRSWLGGLLVLALIAVRRAPR